MFVKRKGTPGASAIDSLIGRSMQVDGSIRFSGGLRVDGEVRGDVVCDADGGLLVISDSGRVEGRVEAAHVIINGAVHGPVVSLRRLELQPRARVTGDVTYHVLELHPGAVINGMLRHETEASAPALKVVSGASAA